MSKKKEKPCFMEDIYLKHERLMYYIAGKYSEVSAQREDIVQTAVLSLLKNEATLQRLPPYAQINYIAAAVRNTAINTIKRDQKETARCIPLDDLTEDFPQAHIPGAEVRYLEKEKQEELLTAFQEIREEERQLLYGKYLMDLSDTELAQMLGCKPSSVRMKLTRARRAFVEKLREGGKKQYEDAFFALLMNRVAEANGKELMQNNKELLADPNAAVPESLSKRCLHTIEKSYRKAQIQKAAKKTLRTLNRVALWILIPLFMFVGVFAASETVRVKTLNYLVETFDFGTSYELFVGQNNLDIPDEDNKARVLNAAPADFILTTGEESETSCIYHFQNSRNEEFEVAIYYISEGGVSTVTIDTEDAEVREENLDDQGVSIVHKNNFYQIFWLEDTSNLMFVVYGEDISLDVLQSVAERIIHT